MSQLAMEIVEECPPRAYRHSSAAYVIELTRCESCGTRAREWLVLYGDDGEMFFVCSQCLPPDVEFSRNGETAVPCR